MLHRMAVLLPMRGYFDNHENKGGNMKIRRILSVVTILVFWSNISGAQTLPEQLTKAASLIDTSPAKTLFLPGRDPVELGREATKNHSQAAKDGWELFAIEAVKEKKQQLACIS